MQVRPDEFLETAIGKRISLMLLSSVTAFTPAHCLAAELTVSIKDARGRPVPDAVVVAQGPTPVAPPTDTSGTAVMDQVRKAFVPGVLVVRTGTPVLFPNSDTIAHQVYSFSSTKRFELGLYRGHPHPPVIMDRPGLVVLGCNIHDNMVGYIVVTDSPYFGKSDERGDWRTGAMPAAEYELSIWSPRLSREANALRRRVTLSESAPVRVELQMEQLLRPDTDTSPDARVRDY